MHPDFGFDICSRFGDVKDILETCMRMKIAVLLHNSLWKEYFQICLHSLGNTSSHTED